MKPHYISNIRVEKLWGGKPIEFDLHEDVNVIIGPNASGKTTIINLLMYTLTGNFIGLIDYQFDSFQVTLRPFDSVGKVVVVRVIKSTKEIRFEIDNKAISIPHFPGSIKLRDRGFTDVPPEILRRHFSAELFELKRHLQGLVPAA